MTFLLKRLTAEQGEGEKSLCIVCYSHVNMETPSYRVFKKKIPKESPSGRYNEKWFRVKSKSESRMR
jgi:hypothetical protein